MLVPLVGPKGLPKAHWGFMSPQVLSSTFCQPVSVSLPPRALIRALQPKLLGGWEGALGGRGGALRGWGGTQGQMGRSTGVDGEEHSI